MEDCKNRLSNIMPITEGTFLWDSAFLEMNVHEVRMSI